MFTIFGSGDRSAAEGARLERIERKLDLVMQSLGIAWTEPNSGDDLSQEVRWLADEGRTIEAIKVHRLQTGAGLRDSKLAIDRYRLSRPS